MPNEIDIAVLKKQQESDEGRALRSEELLSRLQSLLSAQAAQVGAMNENVRKLNHNIELTCARLNDMALQGHEARIATMEEWRRETGAKLDAFLVQATRDIAELRATLAIIEEWRKAMFMKVLGLMALAASAVLAIQRFVSM